MLTAGHGEKNSENEFSLCLGEHVPLDASGTLGFLSHSVRAGVEPSSSAPLWAVREEQK